MQSVSSSSHLDFPVDVDQDWCQVFSKTRLAQCIAPDVAGSGRPIRSGRAGPSDPPRWFFQPGCIWRGNVVFLATWCFCMLVSKWVSILNHSLVPACSSGSGKKEPSTVNRAEREREAVCDVHLIDSSI